MKKLLLFIFYFLNFHFITGDEVSNNSIFNKNNGDVIPITTYLEIQFPQCMQYDFKTFADIKTLNNADESTLEIRADNQSQTEEQFIAKGNAEAERINDFLKADTISYNTNAKNLKASGNTKYFNQDITIYSKSATYKNSLDEINFSKAKYYKTDKSGSGNAEEIFIKNLDYYFCLKQEILNPSHISSIFFLLFF